MLPISYEWPAAIALVLGGALACFAGYRLFRIVLAIYGFIAGSVIASSMMGAGNTAGMVLAAIAGGLAGAVLMFFAYFVGIALIGAGLGVFAFQMGWARFGHGDPPWGLVLAFAALGTIVALVLQRYVIIVTTAFSGAWSIILGALALRSGASAVRGASSAWVLYPLTPMPGAAWVPLAWVALGVLGMVVQLGITSRRA